MTAWVYANIWESVAAAIPDEPVIVQGDRVVSFAEFDAQADALAAHLLAAGLTQQAKVAVYAPNGPEFLTAYFAAFKAGLAPFNGNYRYGPEEVRYLLDNGDAQAVVYDAGFAQLLDAVRAVMPRVNFWITFGEAPDWAGLFDAIAARVPAVRPV